MGCTHDRIDNSNYEDPFYPEERDIRKWEISLGFFNKTFFEVVSEFNSKNFLEDEEITNKKFESFLNKVFRDKNKDMLFDMNPATIETGVFGINIHRSNPTTESMLVENWSEGCSVFKRAKDFAEFMKIVNSFKISSGNKFTYTLLESKDLV